MLRKSVCLLFFILAYNGVLKACHVAGGNITCAWLSPDMIKVRLTLFRECACNSGSDWGTKTFTIGAKNNCGVVSGLDVSPLPATGMELPSACETEATTCNGGSRYGVDMYQYDGIFVIPPGTDTSCQDWHFTFSTGARNISSTLNPTGPYGLFVDCYFNGRYQPNSSPRFQTMQIPAYCIREPVSLIVNTQEQDGDSLVYSLTTAQSGSGFPCTYNPGYTPQSPAQSTLGITLDPLTGNISFEPTQVENVVFVLKVEEYRNGVLIGYVKNDIQLVLSAGNICDNVTPTYRQDTIARNCGAVGLRVPLSVPVNCYTVTPTASEFRLYHPEGKLIPIMKAEPDTCNASNRSTSITLTLQQPLAQNGYYYLVSRKGLDGNTFGNKCDKYMKEFDTLVIAVSGCPDYQTPMQLVNVSVDSLNQNATYVQWLDPDTLNYNWFSAFLLWRRDNLLNTGYQRVLYTENDPAARYFVDVYPETLPRYSRIYYKVNLTLSNLVRNSYSNELGTIRLENNPPDIPEQNTLSLQWSPYEGWPAPLYLLQYKKQEDLSQEWLFPESIAGTTDTMMEYTKPVKPGKYQARILTISPNTRYRSYSNWISFEVAKREVKAYNVVTPNGDGLNDYFYFENLEFYPGSKLQVFNRWGQQVYSHTAYNNDWEPNDLEEGSYFYTLLLPEGEPLKGMFAVLR